MNRSYCELKSGCSVIKDNGAWALVDSDGITLTKTLAKPDRKAFKILHDWFYSKIRDEVFKRDGYQCVQCGSRFMLSCHHKEHRSQSGVHSLENCITLCIKCHEGEHK